MGIAHKGRKSAAASLSIVKPKPPATLMPKNLPPEEAKIWREIEAAMPHGFFNQANAAILRCLVSHIATANHVSAELATARDGEDMSKVDLLSKIHAGESKAVADLSTKLRLTPRSKYSQESASALQALNSSTRPWELKR